MKNYLFLAIFALTIVACDQSSNEIGPNLTFELHLDGSQVRLNNLGQPAVIPQNHAAQTPEFREMALHYIELAQEPTTAFGKGAIVYQSTETTAGGTKAIDFEQLPMSGDNQQLLKLNIADLPPGTYNWIRASVAYQSYDIRYNLSSVPSIGTLNQQKGIVNSFLGYSTFIKELKPRAKPLSINGNRAQGFWAFETDLAAPYTQFNKVLFGQAPAGATTVVNPLFQTSPIPAGSCVVTGQLDEPLVITGNEREDMVIVLSFSINKSLEWVDDNDNGQLDFYAAGNSPNEKIVDMGVRGLKCSIKR